MKRLDLLKYLRDHGYNLIREGGRHSWWGNAKENKRSAVPRHNEIHDNAGAQNLPRSGRAAALTEVDRHRALIA
jgi:mRNA interferase HicA